MKTVDSAAYAAARGLRCWRRDAAMTQTQLAECCGVSRSQVIRWESTGNSQAPSVVHLLRLCAATGAHPARLWAYLVYGGGRDGYRSS